MDELIWGGYSASFRVKILTAAIVGYTRMWNLQREGKGHINRPEATSRSTRRWKKLCGKNTWFKQKSKSNSQEGDARSNRKKHKKPPEIEGIMYVPFTVNSSLKKQMQSAEDQFNGNSKTGKVRILERLGPTVKDLL